MHLRNRLIFLKLPKEFILFSWPVHSSDMVLLHWFFEVCLYCILVEMTIDL